jgi:hypothetical protein
MTQTQLNVPYGTYGATTPTYAVDKSGAIYTTSVGRLNGGGPWGTRLWKIEVGKNPQQVFFAPGNISLVQTQGKLLIIWTDPSRGGYNAAVNVTEVAGFIPLDADISGTVVNIDAAQVAELKLSIQQATALANRAAAQSETANNLANQVNTLVGQLRGLESRLAGLEKIASQPAKQSLSAAEIADLVWTKIWDVMWIIRQGMIKDSTDPNVVGWVNDLREFIKKGTKQ